MLTFQCKLMYVCTATKIHKTKQYKNTAKSQESRWELNVAQRMQMSVPIFGFSRR